MSSSAEHFVTLFDRGFLPQGLALHASLQRHAAGSVLWVLCMDDAVHAFLAEHAQDTLRPIALSEIETPTLRALREERSRAEYCWTLTPLTPKLVFERAPEVDRVTYLDADLYFLGSPRILIDEFVRSGKSVLITHHAYDPEFDQSALSGRFCVQFMSFVRDRSESVRHWWEERCIEWCYARSEDGRFGDQKYLDDWPSRFPDEVHVLQAHGALLAPWNARRFPHGEAVAWHFHGLRLLPGRRVLLYRDYVIPDNVRKEVYAPYVMELRRALDMIGEEVVQAQRSRIWIYTVGVIQSVSDAWRRLASRMARMSRVEEL